MQCCAGCLPCLGPKPNPRAAQAFQNALAKRETGGVLIKPQEKIFDVNFCSWSSPQHLELLAVNNAKVVKDTKERYHNVSLDRTMGELIQASDMIYLAQTAADKHPVAETILKVMLKYQDLSCESVEASGCFVQTCLNALSIHQLAAELIRNDDVQTATSLFEDFKEEAHEMAEKAGALADKTQELASLAGTALEIAKNAEITDNTSRSEALAKQMQLKADAAVQQSRVTDYNKLKEEEMQKEAAKEQEAQAKRDEAREARTKMQIELENEIKAKHQEIATQRNTYFEKKRKIQEDSSEVPVTQEHKDLQTQEDALHKAQNELEEAKSKKENVEIVLKQKLMEERQAKAKQEAEKGAVTRIGDALGGAVGDFFAGPRKECAEAAEKNKDAQAAQDFQTQVEAEKYKCQQTITEKQQEVAKIDEKIKRMSEVLAARATLENKSLTQLETAHEEDKKVLEDQLAELKAKRDHYKELDERDAQELQKIATDAEAAAKEARATAKKAADDALLANSTLAGYLEQIKTQANTQDELGKAIVLMGTVVYVLGQVRATFKEVELFWRTVGRQSKVACDAGDQIVKYSSVSKEFLNKKVETSALTWACLGIINHSAHKCLVNAMEQTNDNMRKLTPSQGKEKTLSLVNDMMQKLNLDNKAVQDALISLDKEPVLKALTD